MIDIITFGEWWDSDRHTDEETWAGEFFAAEFPEIINSASDVETVFVIVNTELSELGFSFG